MHSARMMNSASLSSSSVSSFSDGDAAAVDASGTSGDPAAWVSGNSGLSHQAHYSYMSRSSTHNVGPITASAAAAVGEGMGKAYHGSGGTQPSTSSSGPHASPEYAVYPASMAQNSTQQQQQQQRPITSTLSEAAAATTSSASLGAGGGGSTLRPLAQTMSSLTAMDDGSPGTMNALPVGYAGARTHGRSMMRTMRYGVPEGRASESAVAVQRPVTMTGLPRANTAPLSSGVSQLVDEGASPRSDCNPSPITTTACSNVTRGGSGGSSGRGPSTVPRAVVRSALSQYHKAATTTTTTTAVNGDDGGADLTNSPLAYEKACTTSSVLAGNGSDSMQTSTSPMALTRDGTGGSCSSAKSTTQRSSIRPTATTGSTTAVVPASTTVSAATTTNVPFTLWRQDLSTANPTNQLTSAVVSDSTVTQGGTATPNQHSYSQRTHPHHSQLSHHTSTSTTDTNTNTIRGSAGGGGVAKGHILSSGVCSTGGAGESAAFHPSLTPSHPPSTFPNPSQQQPPPLSSVPTGGYLFSRATATVLPPPTSLSPPPVSPSPAPVLNSVATAPSSMPVVRPSFSPSVVPSSASFRDYSTPFVDQHVGPPTPHLPLSISLNSARSGMSSIGTAAAASASATVEGGTSVTMEPVLRDGGARHHSEMDIAGMEHFLVGEELNPLAQHLAPYARSVGGGGGPGSMSVASSSMNTGSASSVPSTSATMVNGRRYSLTAQFQPYKLPGRETLAARPVTQLNGIVAGLSSTTTNSSATGVPLLGLPSPIHEAQHTSLDQVPAQMSVTAAAAAAAASVNSAGASSGTVPPAAATTAASTTATVLLTGGGSGMATGSSLSPFLFSAHSHSSSTGTTVTTTTTTTTTVATHTLTNNSLAAMAGTSDSHSGLTLNSTPGQPYVHALLPSSPPPCRCESQQQLHSHGEFTGGTSMSTLTATATTTATVTPTPTLPTPAGTASATPAAAATAPVSPSTTAGGDGEVSETETSIAGANEAKPVPAAIASVLLVPTQRPGSTTEPAVSGATSTVGAGDTRETPSTTGENISFARSSVPEFVLRDSVLTPGAGPDPVRPKTASTTPMSPLPLTSPPPLSTPVATPVQMTRVNSSVGPGSSVTTVLTRPSPFTVSVGEKGESRGTPAGNVISSTTASGPTTTATTTMTATATATNTITGVKPTSSVTLFPLRQHVDPAVTTATVVVPPLPPTATTASVMTSVPANVLATSACSSGTTSTTTPTTTATTTTSTPNTNGADLSGLEATLARRSKRRPPSLFASTPATAAPPANTTAAATTVSPLPPTAAEARPSLLTVSGDASLQAAGQVVGDLSIQSLVTTDITSTGVPDDSHRTDALSLQPPHPGASQVLGFTMLGSPSDSHYSSSVRLGMERMGGGASSPLPEALMMSTGGEGVSCLMLPSPTTTSIAATPMATAKDAAAHTGGRGPRLTSPYTPGTGSMKDLKTDTRHPLSRPTRPKSDAGGAGEVVPDATHYTAFPAAASGEAPAAAALPAAMMASASIRSPPQRGPTGVMQSSPLTHFNSSPASVNSGGVGVAGTPASANAAGAAAGIHYGLRSPQGPTKFATATATTNTASTTNGSFFSTMAAAAGASGAMGGGTTTTTTHTNTAKATATANNGESVVGASWTGAPSITTSFSAANAAGSPPPVRQRRQPPPPLVQQPLPLPSHTRGSSSVVRQNSVGGGGWGAYGSGVATNQAVQGGHSSVVLNASATSTSTIPTAVPCTSGRPPVGASKRHATQVRLSRDGCSLVAGLFRVSAQGCLTVRNFLLLNPRRIDADGHSVAASPTFQSPTQQQQQRLLHPTAASLSTTTIPLRSSTSAGPSGVMHGGGLPAGASTTTTTTAAAAAAAAAHAFAGGPAGSTVAGTAGASVAGAATSGGGGIPNSPLIGHLLRPQSNLQSPLTGEPEPDFQQSLTYGVQPLPPNSALLRSHGPGQPHQQSMSRVGNSSFVLLSTSMDTPYSPITYSMDSQQFPSTSSPAAAVRRNRLLRAERDDIRPGSGGGLHDTHGTHGTHGAHSTSSAMGMLQPGKEAGRVAPPLNAEGLYSRAATAGGAAPFSSGAQRFSSGGFAFSPRAGGINPSAHSITTGPALFSATTTMSAGVPNSNMSGVYGNPNTNTMLSPNGMLSAGFQPDPTASSLLLPYADIPQKHIHSDGRPPTLPSNVVRYEDLDVKTPVGEGASASVFVAIHKPTGRRLAVKRIDLSPLCLRMSDGSPSKLFSFTAGNARAKQLQQIVIRELQVLHLTYRSPFMVKVYNAFFLKEGAALDVVMEFMHYGSLDHLAGCLQKHAKEYQERVQQRRRMLPNSSMVEREASCSNSPLYRHLTSPSESVPLPQSPLRLSDGGDSLVQTPLYLRDALGDFPYYLNYDQMTGPGTMQANSATAHQDAQSSVLSNAGTDDCPAEESGLVEEPFGVMERLVAVVGEQLLRGVRDMHERGYIHRDIKPGNVLVNEHGVVKLSDFGLSQRCDDSGNGVETPPVTTMNSVVTRQTTPMLSPTPVSPGTAATFGSVASRKTQLTDAAGSTALQGHSSSTRPLGPFGTHRTGSSSSHDDGGSQVFPSSASAHPVLSTMATTGTGATPHTATHTTAGAGNPSFSSPLHQSTGLGAGVGSSSAYATVVPLNAAVPKAANSSVVYGMDVLDAERTSDDDGDGDDVNDAASTGSDSSSERLQCSGTDKYMSPERQRGEAHGKPSDIWAVGVTLAEFAAGEYPYPITACTDDFDRMRVMDASVDLEPLNTHRLVPLSSVFQDFIRIATLPDPSQRPTAKELLEHPFFRQWSKPFSLKEYLAPRVPVPSNRYKEEYQRQQQQMADNDDDDRNPTKGVATLFSKIERATEQ